MKGFDDQINTGKRFSNAKKSFLTIKRKFELQYPSKKYPFVLRKIKKDQTTRFSLHFTTRVSRTLESYGPLLQLMTENDQHDLRLWLADTKYGVMLLLMFFCISKPLATLQKMKQNWGLPGFHEVLYIPEIFDLFRCLKSIKTIKDLINWKHDALSTLLTHITELKNYKFGGAKLRHSPARFVTREVEGTPTLVRQSEPNFRDVLRFMHLYADYNLEFLPTILLECTHPWSKLAAQTIHPVTLLKCITGTNQEDIVLDVDAIEIIASAEEP